MSKQKIHVLPAFGLPYAEAGVDATGNATATCPVCGKVSFGATSKDASNAYGTHFTEAAR